MFSITQDNVLHARLLFTLYAVVELYVYTRTFSIYFSQRIFQLDFRAIRTAFASRKFELYLFSAAVQVPPVQILIEVPSICTVRPQPSSDTSVVTVTVLIGL
ncbi:MAG: hypothetical protein EZS28_018765 [Streblomastix strix]|uniref:Uncharacterized protein n=1 Tax=Streblomastix strix TaxID=222440 RepID=A0A5J4VT11_9EUKA|nr:MAG: hypothetical protein EZS28_018765 [Streblomastix strix]